MFDIGFTEIILIAVVGLIVIGPKRLPETVRFLGYWLGKVRRSVQGARQDMEREFGLDEIRRELYNEELLGRMENERQQIERRLGSPSKPENEPTPASLKIPNEEDFIDDGPSEPLPLNEQPGDEQTTNTSAEPVATPAPANESTPETTANKTP